MRCDDTVRIKVVRGDILIKHTLGHFCWIRFFSFLFFSTITPSAVGFDVVEETCLTGKKKISSALLKQLKCTEARFQRSPISVRGYEACVIFSK